MSKRTSKTEHGSALEAFERETVEIRRLCVHISNSLHEYDRDISSVRGGHQDWGHAGTLKHVREQLVGALASISSARENTRKSNARRRSDVRDIIDGKPGTYYVTRHDGRRVRVTVPTK